MTKWKPFSKWTIDEVDKTFQLSEQSKQYPLLTDWINQTASLSSKITNKLINLRTRLIEDIYNWNEEELRINFIGPILHQVDFDQTAYRSFFEREIQVDYQGKPLSGMVDFLVAQGKRVPEAPYFFLHEHKREVESTNDPLGQLMIAMVVAQILNQNSNPIYGAYIIGRAWYFVVLQGQEYAISLAYDGTKDEIFGIYRILCRTKQIIDGLVIR